MQKIRSARLKERLFQDTVYGDLVRLSEIEVAYWSTQNSEFQHLFPIYTKEGQQDYVRWVLRNVQNFHGFKKGIIDHYHKYHQAVGYGEELSTKPTSLMNEILSNYDVLKGRDDVDIWKWWISNGAQEYNMPKLPYLDVKTYTEVSILNFLVDIVWDSRDDLKALFPSPMNESKKDFLSWWELYGIYEYYGDLDRYLIALSKSDRGEWPFQNFSLTFTELGKSAFFNKTLKSITHLKNGEDDSDLMSFYCTYHAFTILENNLITEPTELMNSIIIGNESLKGKDNIFIWKWWLSHGADEFNMPKIPYVNPNDVSESSLIDFLVAVIWDSREDLKIRFPEPKGDSQLQFLSWWSGYGLFEYCGNVSDQILNEITTGKEVGIATCLKALSVENTSVILNYVSRIPQELVLEFVIHNVWVHREDLRTIFSEPDKAHHDAILNWWRERGLHEFILLHKPELEGFIQTSTTENLNVALIGHPTGVFGLGEDIRTMGKALADIGYNVDYYIADEHLGTKTYENINAFTIENYVDKYICNIFVMPAFDLIGLFIRSGVRIFTSTHNISLWQWELEHFPKEALLASHLIDLPLSISNFSALSISKAMSRKVEVLPLVVDKFSVNENDEGLPIEFDDGFYLYFSFDANSYINRKNPLGAIEAFQRAFRKQQDAHFIIKAMNTHNHCSEIWNECKRRALVDDRIIIIDKYLEYDKHIEIMRRSTAVISLHRAEGFGRLMAEAIVLEKPIIASNYSGNLDYLNDRNAMLVDGKLVPIYKKEYHFNHNTCWFEPDINIAADKIAAVYNGDYQFDLTSSKEKFLETYSASNLGRKLDYIIKGLGEE